ncbi:MAG: acetyl-CoA carboxylase biotin carboxyl carrier protein [Gammaproteobacteria bacterium]|nr:acetyl-CoA carboxylase biotin carboxyl carrier protein [Gammaproteobacteria bacterium]MYD79790.1 acetyl-CoA carboxylase biotin carboxyl carrier protein [Gammaproteobacteria bacterium]
MDIDEIKRLIDIVKETGIAELEVREGESLVRVVASMNQETSNLTGQAAGADAMPSPIQASQNVPSNALPIKSPMAGTFYRSPAPELQPFVEVGQRVEIGDVLCIIESMKMMNEVKSERIGTIVDVPIDNGQAIESGATIFYIN